MELFGGSSWVESKPGEGTTFLFTLPKREAEVSARAEGVEQANLN